MKITSYALAATFLSTMIASAEIREAPTMASAVEGADASTLVIFDLDNTVMMPPQSLGGEEWFDYFVSKRTKTYEADGLVPADAKEKAVNEGLVEWNQFHSNAKVVPVEKSTPEIIAAVQAKGAKTMALTARPGELGESTVKQLKSIGIEFAGYSVSSKNLKLAGKYPSNFYKGLLLVGPKNNKGDELVKLVKLLKLSPSKIIFIDNKQHHVENVEKALASLGIPYFGRRHAAADAKIAAMDKDVVELQHKLFFGEVLSNEQAKKIVSK